MIRNFSSRTILVPQNGANYGSRRNGIVVCIGFHKCGIYIVASENYKNIDEVPNKVDKLIEILILMCKKLTNLRCKKILNRFN
jgi:hypothetical protein